MSTKVKSDKSNSHNQILGKWGEDYAERFLIASGYTLVEKNVRTPAGEIDLIVMDKDTVILVEVKTRSSDVKGYPEEAVTDEKLEHMVDSAEWYIQEHPVLSENWRIDVIAIIGAVGCKNPQIEWFQDAA